MFRTGATRETYPNGCHVCEVEIERATGALTIVRYTIANDFGTVVNPSLVAGQIHAGTAQGLGQALCEHAHYDAAGQLNSASFLDYALPRADELPVPQLIRNAVPCTTNPLGIKGCGESGTIAAPAALVSAALDALAPLGVSDIDMPLTPERLWRAMQAAGCPAVVSWRSVVECPHSGLCVRMPQ